MNDIMIFEGLPQFGGLILDRVLIEYEGEPILFTCRYGDDGKAVCLCSEIRFAQRWVIASVSEDELSEAVCSRRDILSLFRDKECLCVRSEDGRETSRLVGYDDMDELELPSPGTII